MALITDKTHKKKLDDYKINIKTLYKDGEYFKQRNTNNIKNDDVKSGVIVKKEYYIDDALKYKTTTFDSRIEYSFITGDELDKEVTCPNCGNKGLVKDFTDGCEYCGTHYNIDYVDKELGSKHHYDYILKSNTYRVVTFIIDFIISFAIMFLFILKTSRTFNSFDVIKIIGFTLLLSLVLYYFFYLIDGYIILGPIKRYKEKQNQKQIEFWNSISAYNVDKKEFFNNANYLLRNYYYKNSDVIDYDIIDYDSFSYEINKDNEIIVSLLATRRVMRYINGSIKEDTNKEVYRFKKLNKELYKLDPGTNLIKCHGCGASINAEHESCDYCGCETLCYTNWIKL